MSDDWTYWRLEIISVNSSGGTFQLSFGDVKGDARQRRMKIKVNKPV